MKKRARKLHVDHLVPLKEAYTSGAHRWSKAKRCHYNNFTSHPFHLILVKAQENLRKGDRAPDRYMPPNPNFKCEYIKQWMTVKVIWDLSFSIQEYEALEYQFYINQCNPYAFVIDDSFLWQQQTYANQPIRACLANN